MKICILDYGLGNIQSLSNAINKIGFENEFYTSKKNEFYDVIFIPGVGSFSRASELIFKKEISTFLKKNIQNNCFIFGICLGMQFLFEYSLENGKNSGLNLLPGNVEKLSSDKSIKLPIIGWKEVFFNTNNTYQFLEKYNKKKFYFIHSYVAKTNLNDSILSYSIHQNIKYLSSIKHKNVFGTQFHPEKSGENGLNFLYDCLKKFIN